jgi:hypothetical protein
MGMCGAAKKERKQDQIRRPECIFFMECRAASSTSGKARRELAGQRNAGRVHDDVDRWLMPPQIWPEFLRSWSSLLARRTDVPKPCRFRCRAARCMRACVWFRLQVDTDVRLSAPSAPLQSSKRLGGWAAKVRWAGRKWLPRPLGLSVHH